MCRRGYSHFVHFAFVDVRWDLNPLACSGQSPEDASREGSGAGMARGDEDRSHGSLPYTP